MAMQIDKTFVVRVELSRVWDLLTDPRQVATLLPGAEITEQVDDKTFKGSITVKVGPVATSYKGTVVFERLDKDAGEAELAARGMDVRGKGGAEMRMKSKLVQRPSGETEVQVTSEVNVTGILAQLGRGMIQDVSDQMFQRFTAAMKAKLEAPAGDGGTSAAPARQSPAQPEEQAPIEMLSFGGAVVGRAIERTLHRPAFWIVITVAAIVAVYLTVGR